MLGTRSQLGAAEWPHQNQRNIFLTKFWQIYCKANFPRVISEHVCFYLLSFTSIVSEIKRYINFQERAAVNRELPSGKVNRQKVDSKLQLSLRNVTTLFAWPSPVWKRQRMLRERSAQSTRRSTLSQESLWLTVWRWYCLVEWRTKHLAVCCPGNCGEPVYWTPKMSRPIRNAHGLGNLSPFARWLRYSQIVPVSWVRPFGQNLRAGSFSFLLWFRQSNSPQWNESWIPMDSWWCESGR